MPNNKTKKKEKKENKKVSTEDVKEVQKVAAVTWLRGRTKRFKTKYGTNVFLSEIKPATKELWCVVIRKNEQRLVLTYEDVKKLVEILADWLKTFKPDQ